ncbi:HAD family hydrolase [Gelria sp. Kuro-4]|uniref:HAD family hydrolase n=1 Tax=Gelria sp. Kuro-4 TaxID=2796927 RepID=UPI001BED60CD|nr:HAD family hydrolase [Gelria sp. Kuro-4]BCV23887.1 haloacid dehalogenase [Gelria sp. Kuro-4]
MKRPFVFFDLDGTLYDFPGCAAVALKATLARAQEELGCPDEHLPALQAAFWQAYFHYLKRESSPGDPRAALEEVLTRTFAACRAGQARLSPHFGRELSGTWLRAFFAALAPFPGVRPLLEELRAAGVILGVVSNGTRPFQVAKLRRLGLKVYFPGRNLFFSGDGGGAKPDPAIFHRALSALHLAPAAGVFVGDSPRTDLAGGLQAGLRVVWLNRYGLPAPEEVRGKIHVVTSFPAAARAVWALLHQEEGG